MQAAGGPQSPFPAPLPLLPDPHPRVPPRESPGSGSCVNSSVNPPFSAVLRLSLMEEDEDELEAHSELSEGWQDADKVSGPGLPLLLELEAALTQEPERLSSAALALPFL